MSIDQVIIEVCADREQSDGFFQLDQKFFLELHQTEIRLIKLKHGRKTKQTQKQINQAIIDLVAGYTQCIDYFGAFGDAVTAYFQIKIKQINKYFQFLSNQNTQNTETQTISNVEIQTKKDLGSISVKTGTQLLPQDERQISAIASKQALNLNLMVYLQNQDINTHIQENMKKQKKIHNAITDSLKQQDDLLMKRKRNRNESNKSRVFLSFSQNALDFSRSIEPSETSDLMFTDMQALEANSPEQLRAFALRLTQQMNKINGYDQKID